MLVWKLERFTVGRYLLTVAVLNGDGEEVTSDGKSFHIYEHQHNREGVTSSREYNSGNKQAIEPEEPESLSKYRRWTWTACPRYCGSAGFDNDDHKPWRSTWWNLSTMLNELHCTFGVSFSRFHCCGRHGRSEAAEVHAAYHCRYTLGATGEPDGIAQEKFGWVSPVRWNVS